MQLNRRSFLGLTLAGSATFLAACAQEEGASQNAVAVGGTFQFHSPGGETIIRYEESERQPVGNFGGPSLMDQTQEIQLSDFAGQVVVLNAWGQWCAPCRAEVDDLQLAHEELQKQGGTVLGINVRDYQPEIAQDFKTDNGVTYPSVYDPPFKSALALGGVPTSVIPTTIVLDRQHRPATVFLQAVTFDEIMDAVRPVLEEQA
ncbi:TlpA disulfide reductase family protein [Corynebacterium guangdongense]|uniref:Peroxiredoxin n=1 Tax=Corynebacterium guangdongense TaxID=1783348 RepID=A0ABU1ZWZ4_9CORY|nr:TlpA disulfide reductase family protein [Corynebacterium guangdongense]MDR7328443.1 peroxiredoxin [Corynebacterium guangdongense]WJZ17020.1 Thiol-disulfide oxidoreductase ResA [Corynebacterium guangdongense]